jgi:hypothetical protein
MFVELFHGRVDLKIDMVGWGTVGPTFECCYVRVEYGNSIRCVLLNGDEFTLHYVDDCVYYDGVYYGGTSFVPETEFPEDIVKFFPHKATIISVVEDAVVVEDIVVVKDNRDKKIKLLEELIHKYREMFFGISSDDGSRMLENYYRENNI